MRGTGRGRARTFLSRVNSFASRPRSATNKLSNASSGSFPELGIQRASSRHLKAKPKVFPQSTKHKGIFEKWQFSAVKQSEDELNEAAVELMEKAFRKLHSSLKKSKLKELMSSARPAITEFVDTIQHHYNDSAFHSFVHAVDVAQLMYTLLEEYFVKKIKGEEYFYLIVAALCHDINHPGASAKTLKALGLLEEDMSLEDYHVQKTLQLFENGNLELITNETFLPQKNREELFRYCRILIEATDIGKHNKYVDAVWEKLDQGNSLNIDHLAILIKVADLANIAREFSDSTAWSVNFKVETAAEVEFMNSKEVEMFKLLDLPRDEMFARLSKSLITRQIRIKRELIENAALKLGTSKTTLGFMKLFAFPLVACLEKMSPSAGNMYGSRIRKNQENWVHAGY